MSKDVTLHRLSESQYKELERQCQPTRVETNTTSLQAAYALGQQDVLKKLRDGFTISA